MNLTRRKLWTLFVVGVILSAAGPALGTVLSEMVHTPSGVSVRATDGPAATVHADRVDLREFQEDPNTLDLTTSEGNISLSADGHPQVTVNRISGTWTNLSALDASTADLTVNPEDKQQITVGGDVTSLDFRAMTVENSPGGEADVVYTADGETTLTVEGLASNTSIVAVGRDSDSLLAVSTTDESGSTTLSLPAGEHAVDIRRSAGGPRAHESTASPQSGAELTSREVQLAMNVSDPDLADGGDELTVEFVFDGEVVATKTVTENGTVSTEVTENEGGSHSWSVTVTDEFGQSDTSDTQTVQLPGTLYIRPIGNTSALIEGENVTVTGRFFSGELIFEKETSDGKINMTNLPVDRTYVLVLDAENYYRRTVIIQSLFDQDSAYLLNQSEEAYYTEFVLNDLTGEFSGSGSDTKLHLERGINTSDGIEWRTVAGDYFGAEGRFEANLQRNERYRVRIVSGGSSRVLGEYTASREGTVKFDVGDVRWSVDEPDSLRHSASFHNLTDEGEPRNGVVHFQYFDPNETTSRLHVIIHEQGNQSNQLMNSNFTEGYGTFSLNETIEGDQMEKQWVVDWRAYNSSGDVIASSSNSVVGQRHRVENPFGAKWTPVVLTTLFLFVGTMFGGRLSSLGALATTGIASVTWWMGWYAASGGVVVFAGLVGLAFAVGGGGRR